MSALQPATLAKLGKLLPLLASDKDGEVVATARAMLRILGKSGASLHDVAAKLEAEPAERIVYRDRIIYHDAPQRTPTAGGKASKQKQEPPQEMDGSIDHLEVGRLCDLLLVAGGMTEREDKFVRQMRASAKRMLGGFRMTVKQAAWFRRIVDEMGVDEPRERAA